MRRLVLLLALLAALAAGCGGGKSSAPTTDTGAAKKTIPLAEYASRADAICLAVARRSLAIQKQIETANSPGEAADRLEMQLENVRDFGTDLAALGAPEGHEAVARKLVAEIRAAEPSLARVIEATRNEDGDAASAAARSYQKASLESARYARSSGLGFKVCGAGA